MQLLLIFLHGVGIIGQSHLAGAYVPWLSFGQQAAVQHEGDGPDMQHQVAHDAPFAAPMAFAIGWPVANRRLYAKEADDRRGGQGCHDTPE